VISKQYSHGRASVLIMEH